MSSDDRDVPEFDDFDLPEGLPQPEGESTDRTDDLPEPMPGSGEDTAQPLEGTMPGSVVPGDAPTEEFAGPLPGGLAAMPSEETEEEPPEAEEEEAEEKKEKGRKESFLENLAAASPFTVMLAVSLTAILLSILLLFMELQDYKFDLKAKEAEQRVGAAPAVQSALPSTTAAA